MLLSVIFTFGRETSPLQCAKSTDGYCFAFFMKLPMNTEVLILCNFFFPLQKSNFFLTFTSFRHSYQQTTTNTGMNFVYVLYSFHYLSLENTSFSPFTFILSVQTHSICGARKCHLLRVDHAHVYIIRSPGRLSLETCCDR